MTGPPPARSSATSPAPWSATPGPLPAGLDRPQLVAAVDAGLRSVPASARVVVAVSGGPDSTALAYLVAEARTDLTLTLVHVRHGLRDDTADVSSVRRHAAFLGAPLRVVDVRVVRAGRGTEAAARDARYAALRAAASDLGAEVIAVGHSADDQAETVVLRLARGTGVAGLAAMAARRGDLVRPLLRVRRGDLRTFLDREGLDAVMDPTNLDPAVRRVRVRTDLLPAFDAIGPDPVGALGRLAALAAEDDAALEAAAAAVIAAAVVTVGAVRSIRDDRLAAHPVAVRRRVWRGLIGEVSGGPPPSAADVAALDGLGAGQRRQLPGGTEVAAAAGWRTVAPGQVPAAEPRRIAAPGITRWEPAGIWVTARAPGLEPPAGTADPPGQIAFELTGAWNPPTPDDAALLVPPGGHADRCHLAVADDGPWWLRHRRAGDRIRTAVGTARIAAVMVDAGMPRAVRERWPVVTDADDVVVWVPGIAVDAAVLTAGRADPAVQLVVGPAGADVVGPAGADVVGGVAGPV